MSNNTYRVFVDATMSSHARYAVQRPNTTGLEFHVEPFVYCSGREALLLYGTCKALDRVTEHAAPVEIVTQQHSISALMKFLLADPLRVHFQTSFTPHARAAYTALLASIGNRPVTFDNPTPNENWIFNTLEAEANAVLASA
jgi:hypothetical protein